MSHAIRLQSPFIWPQTEELELKGAFPSSPMVNFMENRVVEKSQPQHHMCVCMYFG